MIIQREFYLKKIRKLLNMEEVKVITGVRRCGKTFFLKSIINELQNNNIKEENIIYLSFESSKYMHITNHIDLVNYIMNKTENIEGKIYLFFDEIHLVKNWEKAINSFRIDLDSDIYITGSNSKILDGELATLLSGRYIKFNIFPFSFSEFLHYHSINKNLTNMDEVKLFEEYLKFGGFPGLLKYDKQEKLEYLKDIYNSIVLKDIILKNNIRNVDLLERLAHYVISNTGNVFSSGSISKYLKNEYKVSPKTILNYLNNMLNAFLIYGAKKEDLKGKKILKSIEKYYCIDPGFYYLFNDESKRDFGNLLENVVYIELIRRGYDVYVGKVYDFEVDFVCKKPGELCYVQVSETILDEKTREREFHSLNLIKDNYPKYLLTLDTLKFPQNGILHLNLIDFLKGKNFIEKNI